MKLVLMVLRNVYLLEWLVAYLIYLACIDKPCLVWYHVFMKTFEELRDDLYARLDESRLSSREWVACTDSFKELCERYTEFYEQILDEVFEQKHLDLWASVWCWGVRKMPSWWASASSEIKAYELEYFIQHDRDFR